MPYSPENGFGGKFQTSQTIPEIAKTIKNRKTTDHLPSLSTRGKLPAGRSDANPSGQRASQNFLSFSTIKQPPHNRSKRMTEYGLRRRAARRGRARLGSGARHNGSDFPDFNGGCDCGRGRAIAALATRTAAARIARGRCSRRLRQGNCNGDESDTQNANHF